MSRTNEWGQPIGDALAGWTPPPPPTPVTLAGRHVTLEPVSVRHAQPLLESLCGPGNADLWTYRLDLEAPDTLEEAQALAEAGATRPGQLTFAVVPRSEGVARGVTSLYRIDPANGSIEVGGIVYARSLQRTPASTEATYLLARHVFEDLGYRRLEWKLDSCNEPSAAAARRLGFSYEGRHRQAVVYKDRNRDTDWFSMLDREWAAVRAGIEAWLDPANFDNRGRQLTRLWIGEVDPPGTSDATQAPAPPA